MKPTLTVAAAALINSGSEILMAQRPPEKSMGGLWEFPGGKLEPGETNPNCLVREIKEELGVTLNPEDLQDVGFVSHGYDNFNLLMFLYMIDCWEGEVKPLEHKELKWVSVDRLPELPMPPADYPLIAPLARKLAERHKK